MAPVADSTAVVEGDAYLGALANFIRLHEATLAQWGRKSAPAGLSWTTILTLGSVTTPTKAKKPLVLRLDPHHLFFVLLKFEEEAIPGLGQLDTLVQAGFTKPMSIDYSGTNLSFNRAPDNSDSMSILSTFSGISSNLSVGSGWWGASKPTVNVSQDVKYIYSSCTKLPALHLVPFCFSTPTFANSSSAAKVPTLQKPVKDFQDCPPEDTAVPLYAFKNLQSLVIEDLDPRAFVGWDFLSAQLRSLEVKRSGIEDVGELICDAVCEDYQIKKNGRGKVGEERQTRLGRNGVDDPPPSSISDDPRPLFTSTDSYLTPPPTSWRFLVHLSLSSNSLTFVPSTPLSYLPALTSLDLSSNLLISVPPGLSSLPNLRSLNLSDNMIESLVGVSKALGNVAVINLSKNRIDNLSGLDRIFALERLDLRENRLRESAEVGRLASLPFLKEVWVAGNPFSKAVLEGGEEGYRVKCFNYFVKEGKDVENFLIDGTGPGLSERRGILVKEGKPLTRRSNPTLGTGDEAPLIAGETKVVGRRVVTAPHSSRIRSSTAPTTKSDFAAPPLPPNATHPPSPLIHAFASPSATLHPLPQIPTTPSTSPPSSRHPSPTPKPHKRKPKRIVDLDGRTPHPASTTTNTSLPPDPAADSSSGADGTGATSSEEKSPPTDAPSDSALQDGVRRIEIGNSSSTSSSPNPSSFSPPAAVRRSSSISPSKSLGHSFLSKSARRDRVSASVYEPAHLSDAFSPDRSPSAEGVGEGEKYRAKIEALRNEVGESWLSVLAERDFAKAESSGSGTDAVRSTGEEGEGVETKVVVGRRKKGKGKAKGTVEGQGT